jgi:hypothetical protein
MVHRSRRPGTTRRAAALVGLLGSLLLAPEVLAQSSSPECRALPEDRPAMEATAEWIAGLQFAQAGLPSAGALPIHHTAGFVDATGVPYFDVVPYSANLAVAGLLKAPVAGRLEVAEAWIRWVLAHLTPAGTIRRHWYRADGTGETTCVLAGTPGLCDDEDAQDTTAGTFLGMVWAYVEAGGSRAFLVERRAGLEAVADLLLGLQQSDGLTRETARSPVKFLMNNAEAHWGLDAMRRLEETLFSDPAAALRYQAAAARLRQAVGGELFDRQRGLYHVAKGEHGAFQAADLDVWFPGTVAIVWPHLVGVTAGRSQRARAQMAALDAQWDGAPHPDWTTGAADPAGFRWPAVARAAQLAGACARARAHAARLTAEVLPAFEWPWTMEDAGWFLRTLAGFGEGGPSPDDAAALRRARPARRR